MTNRGWLGTLGIVVLVLMAAACGDDAPTRRGAAMVTMDVFSGLPNPTWELGADETAEMVSRWEDLAVATAGEYPGTLGYRGVIVEFEDGSRVWVSGGFAVDETRGQVVARADPGHTLELWLLETGRSTLDPALLESVLAEIAS